MEKRYTFRGKRSNANDPCRGQWAIGDYVGGMAIIHSDPQMGYFIDCAKGEMKIGNTWIVDAGTVGECTGLMDRNERLIFEGDIVKGVGCAGETLVEPVAYTRGEYTPFDYVPADSVEIIGNIHDNPDLLGGGRE